MLLVTAGSAFARSDRESVVLVKFKGAGEHALEGCAETLFREGKGFAAGSADASDSLDRVHERLGVRSVRALFRRPDGRPLVEQRAKLREGLSRAADRRHARLHGRSNGASPNGNRGARNAHGRRAADDSDTDLAHIYRVTLGPEVTLEEAVAVYSEDPHVAWVQRDHAVVLDAMPLSPLGPVPLPDDPFLSSSGSWGQAFEDLWGLHRIRAPEAWALSRGEGVVVAVVDTGLDYEHPDVGDNVWVNPGEDLNGNGVVDESDWNGIDDDANGFIDDLRGFDFANSVDADGDGFYDGPDDVSDPDPFDDLGHGTHVSGIISAVGNNGLGVIGVAYRAKLMPLKGFSADGTGNDALLWRAVLYAVMNGASVVNNSWSCSPMCPRNPLAEEVARVAVAHGVVIVTSAGNARSDVVRNSPENLREVITVASTGQDDALSVDFSNRGWLVDLAAPGGNPPSPPSVFVPGRNILSLRSSVDESALPFALDEDYFRSRGTSSSAPHVSGAVALLLSARPGLGYEEVRRLLRQSAKDLGEPGHDYLMGAGRLDARSVFDHPPLPDLGAALTSPLPGSLFGLDSGVVEILGSASGEDLLDYTLSLGVGTDPDEWLPLVEGATRPIVNGVLGHIDASALEQGIYVVRLEVRATEGSLYSEFIPISVEWREFERISSLGAGATRPDISGDLVVWQSRRDPAAPENPSNEGNLFISDLSSGDEYAIPAGEGHRREAKVRGDVVTWLDSEEGAGRGEMRGCWLDRRSGACAEFAIAPGLLSHNAAVLAVERAYWVEERSGLRDIRACVPDPLAGDCRETETNLAPDDRSLLTSDGDALAWWQGQRGRHIATCEPEPKTGACDVASTSRAIPLSSRPVVSGDLLAWVGFQGARSGLRICLLERETGDCRSLLVREGVTDLAPRLSGNRLVWEESVDGGLSDIFFCEFDPRLRTCPVQRLTAEHSGQIHSGIDGDRVVWEDSRSGTEEIHGIVLPSFEPLLDRTLLEGRPLKIRVRAHDPQGGRLDLDARVIGDVSLENLGMTFEDRGRGRGRLRWRPGFDQAGDYLVEFSATREDRLVVRRTVRIVVIDNPRVPWGRPWSVLGARGLGAHSR